MQKRKTELTRDRPSCPIDSSHAIYAHGSYSRYGSCDAKEKDVVVPRYLCAPCGNTISVLPEDRLPYRAVGVEKLEKHFQAVAAATPPPPATEKEKGCLKRAWHSFERHVTKLTAVLGQIIARVKPNDGADLWKQLRPLGNLEVILGILSDPFKTSLLKDYVCLQPWPAAPE